MVDIDSVLPWNSKKQKNFCPKTKKIHSRKYTRYSYSPVLASVYLQQFQDRSNRGHLLPLGQTLDSNPLDQSALAQPNVLYQKVWVINYDSNMMSHNDNT